MNRVAYIQCAAGASGDMFLGAWLDAGVDQETWRNIVQQLDVDGYTINLSTVFKHGIRAMKVDVDVIGQQPHFESHGSDAHGDHTDHVHHGHKHHHPHRHLKDIYHILDRSDLPNEVCENSKLAFALLAEAEAQVHGMSPEAVHFHEVGAVDAIVDIVGAMAGWYLAGMPNCYVSDIEVGGGTVRCAHGLMPVPAPATALLLQGFTSYSSGPWGETVTPTGAAIIRALCKGKGMPRMVPERIGYGAGTKDFPVANVLRIQLGTLSSTEVHAVAGDDTDARRGIGVAAQGAH